MSNMHNMSVTVVMKRPKGCKNKVPTSCPSIIADYNVNMGGVDLTDQHLNYYSMTNRRPSSGGRKCFGGYVHLECMDYLSY